MQSYQALRIVFLHLDCHSSFFSPEVVMETTKDDEKLLKSNHAVPTTGGGCARSPAEGRRGEMTKKEDGHEA